MFYTILNHQIVSIVCFNGMFETTSIPAIPNGKPLPLARNRLVTMLCRQHQRRFPLVVGQVHVLGGGSCAVKRG